MLDKPIAFRNEIPYLTKSGYANLLAPLVMAKRGMQILYNTLIRLVWAELIEGKPIEEGMALLAFLAFCVVSLTIYLLKDYSYLIFWGSLGVWFLDVQVARMQYQQAGQRTVITLESKGDWVIWCKTPPDGRVDHAHFQRKEVARIEIDRIEIQAGAFDDKVGREWQVCLRLCDNSPFLIGQEKRVFEALKIAKTVAAQFNVPIAFADSEGNGMYAAKPLYSSQYLYPSLPPSPQQTASTIRQQKNRQRWHIYSTWKWMNTGFLLQQIFQKCGFFIFVLIMANFMFRFGRLLHLWLSPLWGGITQVSFADFFALLTPEWKISTFLELGLIATILILRAAQISQEEHFWIDQEQLVFQLNQRPIARLKTENIETVVLIQTPQPVLLIVGSDQIIQVAGLQQEQEFRTLLLHLDEAIAHFQHYTP